MLGSSDLARAVLLGLRGEVTAIRAASGSSPGGVCGDFGATEDNDDDGDDDEEEEEEEEEDHDDDEEEKKAEEESWPWALANDRRYLQRSRAKTPLRNDVGKRWLREGAQGSAARCNKLFAAGCFAAASVRVVTGCAAGSRSKAYNLARTSSSSVASSSAAAKSSKDMPLASSSQRRTSAETASCSSASSSSRGVDVLPPQEASEAG